MQNVVKWKAVYDSVQGTSHDVRGLPCQDSCRVVSYSIESDELLIAVCADGAGSAEHSDIGSLIACDRFVEICESHFVDAGSLDEVSNELVSDWLTQIRSSISAKAEELLVDLGQLATTLLGCVITTTGALFVQIGDGAMVYRSDDGLEIAFWPQSGEYVNITNFVTSENYLDTFQWNIVNKPIREYAGFTDGLERLLLQFSDRSVHEPALTPLFQQIRESETGEELFDPLRGFLSSERINERTDDDKTLILAVREDDDAPNV